MVRLNPASNSISIARSKVGVAVPEGVDRKKNEKKKKKLGHVKRKEKDTLRHDTEKRTL